ncbi:MAG TPA: shikimate dehydrogenase [Candidatus Angelobacter sp.]|jgi:shikimate dehydrogenase|nr:shikimate dehydrogenase [Candidatus Angelobacter sp.]
MPSEIWLLGDPVSHSLSPGMQNAAFEALGLDYRYATHQVDRDRLVDAIAELRQDDRILGANVTIPHKQAVIGLLDELDPVAARVGAVNTISRIGQRLRGSNTDVVGFRRALDDCGYHVAGKTVAVIGAGGAARAIVSALQSVAGRVWLIARNLAQAQQLGQDLHLDSSAALGFDRLSEVIARADLLINATPADVVGGSTLRREQQFFDLRSRRSAEGRAMLLHQGAASFEIWTGRTAPLDVMRAALAHATEVVPA